MTRIGLMLALAAAFIPALHAGDPAPSIALVDQTRAVRNLANIGRPAVVSFIYTRCPDPLMCPLVTAKFGRMQTLLRGTPVTLVEVTLDPAFDTPAVMAAYGRIFGADPARWWLLSGDVTTAETVADRFGIATDRTQPGQVIHTEAVALLDGDGRIARVIDGNDWTPEEVVAEIRAVAALPSNPLQRVLLRTFGELAALCGGEGGRGGLSVAAIAGLFVLVLAALSGVTWAIVRREAALHKRS